MNILSTPRLTLSPCCPDDRDEFIALEQDPEVMRFLNGGEPVGLSEPDPNASFLMPRGTEPHVWTARRRSDAAFVGWFCLWPETDELAELGYRLCRTEWGRGLATEGAAALIDWGFVTAGYERIVATTMAVNSASRRVMEKIGLRYDRTELFEGGDPITGSGDGEVWYELARSDWSRR